MEHRHSFRKRQQHRQQGSRTVSRVLDGHNDAGSKHELLPGLGEVDHVQTVSTALPDVRDLPSTVTSAPPVGICTSARTRCQASSKCAFLERAPCGYRGSWCQGGRGRQAFWPNHRRWGGGAPGGRQWTLQTCPELTSAPHGG